MNEYVKKLGIKVLKTMAHSLNVSLATKQVKVMMNLLN